MAVRRGLRQSPGACPAASGGDRLDRALARALAARPYLLLLDEVLAGLNPTEIAEMAEVVRQIRDHGITILIIEHVMHALMRNNFV